jgi:hypothetical protein
VEDLYGGGVRRGAPLEQAGLAGSQQVFEDPAARRTPGDLRRPPACALPRAHAPPPPRSGRPPLLAEYHRPLSAYLTAALPLGFQVRQCKEPRRPGEFVGSDNDTTAEPLPVSMSWDLLRRYPRATDAALGGMPAAVVWHFQLEGLPRS